MAAAGRGFGRGGQGGDAAGDEAGLGGEPGQRRRLGVEPVEGGGKRGGEAAEGGGLLGALHQHLEHLLLAGLDHRQPPRQRAARLGAGGEPGRLHGVARVDHRLGAGIGGGKALGHRHALRPEQQERRIGERTGGHRPLPRAEGRRS